MGFLSSVDKVQGSARIFLCISQVHTASGHTELGLVAHLKLCVIMLYQFVYNTGTPESVTSQTLESLNQNPRSVEQTVVLVQVH